MFSEDKFNELVKNLKAGKDVPTPKPEPVLKHTKKRKQPVKPQKSQPRHHTTHDIGGWLSEVESLSRNLTDLQSMHDKVLKKKNNLLRNTRFESLD